MSILIEVSIGEFLDKISILQIKADRIKNQEKLININSELETLTQSVKGQPLIDSKVSGEFVELRAVNEKLWDIEDEIRRKEASNKFDEEFIDLARAVYLTNDVRAKIKREINTKLNSRLLEEKSYASYTDE